MRYGVTIHAIVERYYEVEAGSTNEAVALALRGPGAKRPEKELGPDHIEVEAFGDDGRVRG